jgi:hypothetical protein
MAAQDDTHTALARDALDQGKQFLLAARIQT